MRLARLSGIVFCTAVWLLCGGVCRAEDGDPSVQIEEEKSGRSIVLIAKLTNWTEATVTVTATLENMTPSSPLPVTVEAKGRTRFTVITFTPPDPNAASKWSYHFDWKGGRRLEKEPKPAVYALPYKDTPHRVIQGALGSFSHYVGSQDEQAIDFGMPVGTEVCAAREGTVVGIRQDVTEGGPDKKFKKNFNYVVVRHDDGTFAEYCHLKYEGVKVMLGDHIQIGQVIALSGNTGWTTTPHLHFSVFYTLDGLTRKTLPVQFQTRTGETARLLQGRFY